MSRTSKHGHVIVVLSIVLATTTAATSLAGRPGIPNPDAGTLYPDHKRVIGIDVSNGPAWLFQAVAQVDLPDDVKGPIPSWRLIELDGDGRPVRRLPFQLAAEGDRRLLVFPLTGSTKAKATRRVLLYTGCSAQVRPDHDDQAPNLATVETLTLTKDADGIRIANRDYGLKHIGATGGLLEPAPAKPAKDDPADQPTGSVGGFTQDVKFMLGLDTPTAEDVRSMGGFPSQMTFMHTGAATDGFYFEDRLYRRDPRAMFLLKDDADAKVSVTSAGPLRTVLRVDAQYRQGKKTTEGNARATYWYTYLAGSPVTHVRAEVRQDEPEAWNELHFLQLSIRDTSFPIWKGADGQSGRFTNSKASKNLPRWAVMSDGTNAIGLLSRDHLIWHDHPLGYCAYLQFPVVEWSTKQHTFEGWLYIGPDQPHRVMELWWQRVTNPPTVKVNPLEPLNTLRARVAKLPPQPRVRQFDRLAGGRESRRPSSPRTPEPIEVRLDRALHRSLLARNPFTLTQDHLDRAARAVQAVANRKVASHAFTSAGETPQAFMLHDKAGRLWLANDHAIFHLDMTHGASIASLLHLDTARDFIGPGRAEPPPLWRLKIRFKDGKTITIDSKKAGMPDLRNAKGTGTSPSEDSHVTFTLTWRDVKVPDCKGVLNVHAHVEVIAGDPMLRARLDVDNQLEDAGLWDVEFPVIGPVGERGHIDLAVPRGNWGILTKDFVGSRGGHYPAGYWPMQYLSATIGDTTLYLARPHPKAATLNFNIQAGGEFKFQIPPPDMGVPGRGFSMQHPVVIGPLAGDWFDAARRYRDWALTAPWMARGPLHQRDDMPKRLRDGLTWLLMSGPPEEVEPKIVAAADFLGVPIGVHWYNWHKIPFDDDYPHYFPTKDGFPAAVKRLQDRGITIMPYINGRLWDTDTDDFDAVAKPAATKGPDDKPIIEVYGSKEKLAVMCPTTDVWQNKVCEIIDGLVNKVGVDAVYLDQIAAARPRLCMDASHGHPVGGGQWWVPAYWKMMDRIQAIGQAKGSQVFFTTENNAEPYSQNIDAFLVWNPRRPEMIPINAVVYGGMRVHFANRVHPTDDANAFAMKVGRDFLWGTQLGWMAPFYMEPAHREKGVYFRRLAKARLMAGKFLGYGQMLRPPEVHCPAQVTARWFGNSRFERTVTWPAVMGACWKAPDGHIGLIFTNFSDQPAGIGFKPSAEAVREMGRHPAWGWLMSDGLHKAGLAGRTVTGYHRARIEPREVRVYEIIPCDSDEQCKKTLAALPDPPEIPRLALVSLPPEKVRRLVAELSLSDAKTPAGQPIPGQLVIDGKRPSGPDWWIRLTMPDGFAVEPAKLLGLKRRGHGPDTRDVLIHPPAEAAAGDVPVRVELIRPLDSEPLHLAPPPKQR